MEFRILGSLEAGSNGERLALGGPRDRKVLAVLLLEAGRTVPVTHLVDALWDGSPPATAAKQARNAVSRLRGVLGDVVGADCGGYRVITGDGAVDAWVFEARTAQAAAALSAGQLNAAEWLLRSALGLWRGPALAGMTGMAIEAAAVAWEERRCAATEMLFDCQLRLGHHAQAVAELCAYAAAHPLRENPARQLMTALYRCGRAPDALALYDRTRRQLTGELGLEPSPALRQLQVQILTADPALLGTPNNAHCLRDRAS